MEVPCSTGGLPPPTVRRLKSPVLCEPFSTCCSPCRAQDERATLKLYRGAVCWGWTNPAHPLISSINSAASTGFAEG